MNAHKITRALLVGVLLTAGSLSISGAETTPVHDHGKGASTTRLALRDLWVEHVFWVRNYVVANETRNAAARAAAENEVVSNAKQIASSVEPFYGKAASDQLLELLAGHWGAVKAISDATIAGNAAKREKATADMTSNAQEIARFLSGANPNLKYDALLGLLAAHGGHHVVQIDQLHAGKYAEEAKTWAMMRGHMLTIADALTGALAKQFPGKV